jgi:uncharacterized protein YjbJ (UPF0337 family)
VGEDPEQLEREIERTRAKLGADIDALEEKVNPKKVAHRQVETAKGKAAELKDKVVEAAGTAKEKVTAAVGDAKAKAADAAGEAKAKAAEAAGEAKGKVAEVKDKATGSGSSTVDAYPATGSYQDGGSGAGLGQKVAGLAGTVKEKAAPLTRKAAPLAQNAKHKAAVRAGLDPATTDTRTVATAFAGGTWSTLQEQTRRNPVAVAAAALLLGFLIGR